MEVNIDMLLEKLAQNNLSKEQFAEGVGMNRATIYRKLNKKGESFTIGEMHRAVEILHLTKSEASDIFLHGFSQ